MEENEEGFLPDVAQGGSSAYDAPPGMDAAWLLKLIEIKELPKEIKMPLIEQLLNVAAKTNIQRNEIPMHLMQYDIIWTSYKIFVSSGKLEPNLKVLYSQIRHALELQLNRSIKGWQGELLFTRKYDVSQHTSENAARRKKFFDRFRNRENDGGQTE